MTKESTKATCFIAMPITVHENESQLYGDEAHWDHVMHHLFIPAIERAGLDAVIPTAAGTSMIHGRIVKHLAEADLVLCDLSQHNPNVLFELGVRTSLNRPVALVKDEYLSLPFDIQGLNTHHYSSALTPWTLERQVATLAAHIRDSILASGQTNPLWEHFGVSIAASQPPVSDDPRDATLQLLLERVEGIERSVTSPATEPRISRMPERRVRALVANLGSIDGIQRVRTQDNGDGTLEIFISTVESSPDAQISRIESAIRRLDSKQYRAFVVDSGKGEIRIGIEPREGIPPVGAG